MSELVFVVPAGIDDVKRPSGGNRYDQRVRDGLRPRGWQVRTMACGGTWPEPDEEARDTLAGRLAGLAAGTVVLIDGLIASCVPDVLASQAARLRIVVLLHMPLGVPPVAGDAAMVAARERRALACARWVIATSDWTRHWACTQGGVAPEHVVVALPGVDPAPQVAVGRDGTRLLCLAAVTALKGHDVLLDALATLRDVPWRLACVGSMDTAPDFAQAMQQRATAQGMAGRVAWHGALHGSALGHAWAGSDLLVLPSRKESYGMVVTEALAHGVPVIASNVGGVSEALGQTADGRRPGELVPAGEATALADALRGWFADPALRRRWQEAARVRRATLQRWDTTVAQIEQALLA